jgi:adenylyltransferase/sulfurtransferase
MIREISVTELSARLARGEATHLIDVREPWEFELGALPGSQHIPLGELPARLDEVRPREGALLVIVCHHGVRSLRAAMFLARSGHPEACSLAGGTDAWSRLVDPSLARY